MSHELNPEIPRDIFLDAIQQLFDNGCRIVTVTGDYTGKTTLLRQFDARHPGACINAFVEPLSPWAYDPDFIMLDIGAQIANLINIDTLDKSNIDQAALRTLFMELQKNARRRRQVYYFIIDGLDGIPQHDAALRKSILELFPWGVPTFRFLLSQTPDTLIDPKSIREVLLTGFSLHEVKQFLAEFPLAQSEIQEFHRICRGMPQSLATIRRLLRSGIQANELIEKLPEKAPDLFAFEWRNIHEQNHILLDILGIIAFSRKRYTLNDLARLIKADTLTVRENLSKLGFITICDDTPSFVGDSMRKYAESRLESRRRKIHDYLIDDLIHSPESDDAVTHLPEYMQEAQQFEKLVEYLKPAFFDAVLEKSQSLAPIQKKAEIGISAAKLRKRDGDLLRFGLQNAATSQFIGADIPRSEVEARMLLGDEESAKRLAQAAVLREDRLHLLAIVAKVQRASKQLVDQETETQIEQLVQEIDASSLGERALDIAADLIAVNSTAAIGLVERASSAKTERSEALDFAFAHLSIAALDDMNDEQAARDIANTIQDKISDPVMRRFSKEAAILFGKYSAREVIAEVEKFGTTSDRMSLLRRWVVHNKRREDAEEVIEYALKIAISSPEYSPTATVLKDLATPLPFLRNTELAQRVTSILDNQRATNEHLSPTDDYVDFWLLLLAAQSRYFNHIISEKYSEIYHFIDRTPDIAVKASCLARFISAFDPSTQTIPPTVNELLLQAMQELRIQVDGLLEKSAEQLPGMKPILKALAKCHPSLACELTQKLNTNSRRNSARLDIIRSILPADLSEELAKKLIVIARKITEPDIQDRAMLELFEIVFSVGGKWTPTESVIREMMSILGTIRALESRCIAASLLYSFATEPTHCGAHQSIVDVLSQKLREWWEQISTGWSRIDIGFRIAQTLSRSDRKEAYWFLKAADEYRSRIGFATARNAGGYLAGLRLTVRAFSGLLLGRVDDPGDVDKLESLIEAIPSPAHQAILWSSIAFRFYLNKRTDESALIVKKHVRPRLDALWDTERASATMAIIQCANSLYIAHKSLTHDQLNKLTVMERDEAYLRICNALLRRWDPHDTYEYVPGSGYELSYEDAIDLVDILRLVESDYAICSIITALADSLTAKKNRDRITIQQRNDLVKRLEQALEGKFPSPGQIQHDGYKILCNAHLERIRNRKPTGWDKLIADARQIPNSADRAFVLSAIASIVGDKSSTPAKDLFQEARRLIPDLPLLQDRIERYRTIAADAVLNHDEIARSCAKEAMTLAIVPDNYIAMKERKQIIDLAYRINPEFANSLAAISDNDPARVRVRGEIRKRIDILAIKKKLSDNTQPLSTENSGREYAVAAWSLLGSINAGRQTPKSPEQVRELVSIASTYAIEESYPIFALSVESIVKKYSATKEARTILRPAFDGIMLAVALAKRLAMRSSGFQRHSNLYVKRELSDSLLVRPGERDRALRYIEEWLRETAPENLMICDPYFGPDDLESLRLIKLACPLCHVQILTSRKVHQSVKEPWEETYKQQWRQSSDEDPPDTDVVIAGFQADGQIPIHDRWWLAGASGIRLGTSYNSLGGNRESDISILSVDEVESRTVDVNRYMNRQVKDHRGKRIMYTSFNL